ncbi:hypothetical protein Bca52824_043587 [Brassica carinata]|uniref:Uncharacterized protein n=1 Tax=Brassica carinata TaxID=52824 RepID=A0A8X7RWU0_BRACI|nr:hypothetical protein Bca52824_043587 [Brassica carinata]
MTGDPGVEEMVVTEAGHVLLVEGLVTEGCREVRFASTSLRDNVLSLMSWGLELCKLMRMKIVFLPVQTAIVRVLRPLPNLHQLFVKRSKALR